MREFGMARVEQKTEITGSVWKIEVKSGEGVSEGDTLIILESMKMEIPVDSTVTGKVVEILVDEEEMVEEGQVVAIIES